MQLEGWAGEFFRSLLIFFDSFNRNDAGQTFQMLYAIGELYGVIDLQIKNSSGLIARVHTNIE